MSAQEIDGKALADDILKKIAAEINIQLQQGIRAPSLAVILVGDNPASTLYVHHKHVACQKVGIKTFDYHITNTTSEEKLIALINKLNDDEQIDGILLQLPLPSYLDSHKIIEAIHPEKDVDGFHPYNLGRLAQKQPTIRPCTPYGVMQLLDFTNEIYEGRHAVVVGASNIVGKPMALELLSAGCTVTICHRLTPDLSKHVKEADILVSAAGKPNLIQGKWIKPKSTIIDVGITRVNDKTIVGDVEFNTAKEKAAWITPVPGGVGPMTVAMLLKNTLLINQKKYPINHSNSSQN